MVGDYRLLKILDSLRTAVMYDGRVTLGETSVILRTIRPFVLKGEPGACELEALLQRVRQDGVVTDEESFQIARLMDKLLSGRPRLADYVREIPDFPKPGVLFRDVTGILESGEGFNLALSEIAEALEGVSFDLVAAPESRGFIFGAAIAARFGKAFVPIRKPGKLPRRTISEDYDLEYGKATLHMRGEGRDRRRPARDGRHGCRRGAACRASRRHGRQDDLPDRARGLRREGRASQGLRRRHSPQVPRKMTCQRN